MKTGGSASNLAPRRSTTDGCIRSPRFRTTTTGHPGSEIFFKFRKFLMVRFVRTKPGYPGLVSTREFSGGVDDTEDEAETNCGYRNQRQVGKMAQASQHQRPRYQRVFVSRFILPCAFCDFVGKSAFSTSLRRNDIKRVD